LRTNLHTYEEKILISFNSISGITSQMVYSLNATFVLFITIHCLHTFVIGSSSSISVFRISIASSILMSSAACFCECQVKRLQSNCNIMTLAYILSMKLLTFQNYHSLNFLVLQGANIEGASSCKLYAHLASSTYKFIIIL
jgi:hypothetical protein